MTAERYKLCLIDTGRTMAALSPDEIFRLLSLEPAGAARWGDPVPCSNPGIYVVSLSEDARVGAGAIEPPPVSAARAADWMAECPQLTLHGVKPSASQLAEHLGRWWLPAAILYIGLSKRPLRIRVGEYYATKLGKTRKHAGGNWVQTLEPALLRSCWVHVAPLPTGFAAGDVKGEVARLERRAQLAFMASAKPLCPAPHPEPTLALPFANIKLESAGEGQRLRAHGIIWRP